MKKKIKWIIVAAAVLVVLMLMIKDSGKKQVTSIERPGYGEEDESYELLMEKDGKTENIEIVVGAKELEEGDLQAAFDESYEEIYKKILGNNEGFDSITTDLNFLTETEKYKMKVEYFLDSYEAVSGFGEVNNSAITVASDYVITVQIYYKDLFQTYEIPITVIPNEITEKEKTENLINEEIEVQNSENIELPSEINGEKVSFFEKNNNMVSVLFLAVLAGGVYWYYIKIYRPKQFKEKRAKQVMEDYSEIISKISLLMGAGMSTYNALIKINEDYKRSKSKKSLRYAYEEINKCINRIASGVMEVTAYKELGQNIGVHSYVKLCNLLIQNINKGTNNIFQLLREETNEAFQERKTRAKKMGEEAGTKLLIPMMMQLSVVLVIIVLPAFQSF